MGASKTEQYTKEELITSLIARALSHPARIRIVSLLKDNEPLRNIDLQHILKLDKKTIHEHIYKLKEALLIETIFHKNCYYIVQSKFFWENVSKLQFSND